MGASSSKPAARIEMISRTVANVKNEIDIFEGNRTNSRYIEFHKILTTLAVNSKKIKSTSKKQHHIDGCDEVLGAIQNCLQKLETRVNLNEQHDVLPNKNWAEELSSKQTEPKVSTFKSLETIEKQTQILENDIKLSIELEDTKEFVIYENKIKILYTNLELMRIEEHSPLGEKKAAIGKRLVKCNKLIKAFKKNVERKAQVQATTQDGSGFSKPATQKKEDSQVDTFTKMEYLLEELEMQALTFEGVKSDKRYKDLEQILENHWTRLYSMDPFGEEERNRRSITVKRTKNILQGLLKRAEENERQLEAIQSIHKIEQDFQGAKMEAEAFKGTTKDPPYVKLDQDLRGLWAKLSQVEEPNEHVRKTKSRVITQIQYVLKNLYQNSKSREIDESPEVIQKFEVKPNEHIGRSMIDIQFALMNLSDGLQEGSKSEDYQYENIEQELAKSLSNLQVIDNIHTSLQETIRQMMQHHQELESKLAEKQAKAHGVDKKQNTLSIIEKRKSDSCLVVPKAIDNADMLKLQPTHIHKSAATLGTDTSRLTYQSHHQPPDLIQQQPRGQPVAIETEIEVQPSVKTFGEMQRVSTEAKSLLQQIRQANCTKHDSECKILEAKLKQCQLTLQGRECNKGSETIERNRSRASKAINEAFKALEEKASKSTLDQEEAAAIRRSKSEEIMDIDAEIHYYLLQIKKFTGVTKDKQFEKIKQGLADSLSKLQIVDGMYKQESIQQIQQYHQELETKLAENQAKVKLSEQNAAMRRQTVQDIKGVVEQLQRLRSQVEGFSGVHQGTLYKEIEDNLKRCLEKLEVLDTRADDKLQNAKFLTKQKIQKYLRMLEDKSTKPSISNQGMVQDQADPDVVHRRKIQRQSQIPDAPQYKINSLRDKLAEVKHKTETFTGKYKDGEYSAIENQLLDYSEELEGIDDRGNKSVIISKQQHADFIEKLLGYFEEKAKLSEEKSEEKVQTATEETEASRFSEGLKLQRKINPPVSKYSSDC